MILKPKLLYTIFASLLLLGITPSYAQEKGAYDTVRVNAYITPEGDTIGESWLPNIMVVGMLSPAQKKYWAEWTRLRNAVYVTYPYAKAASRIMNDINLQLVNVKDKKQRRQIIRSREKDMKKQFTDQLTRLSVYQGKVLMKLINRETGNNCYEIIDEYKGFMTAAFWQTVAVLFGSNLKQAYDPGGKDADMEKIVRDVARMYGYPG